MNAELSRIEENAGDEQPWRFWGPYVSARQWGTVREDYSADGVARGPIAGEKMAWQESRMPSNAFVLPGLSGMGATRF